MPKDLIDILADFIIQEATSSLTRTPKDAIIETIGRMREGLLNIAAIDYPKLEAGMDEHLKNVCDDPNCTICNVAIKQLRKQVALMRKIIEPHTPEVLELFKQSKRIFEALSKLHSGIKQNSGSGGRNN